MFNSEVNIIYLFSLYLENMRKIYPSPALIHTKSKYKPFFIYSL